MSLTHIACKALHGLRTTLVSAAMLQFAISSAFAGALPEPDAASNSTSTPIKHVIVIIGENRSFDHVFATYVPRHGQSVWNLLSQGIVNADGTPGPKFSKAAAKSRQGRCSRRIPPKPGQTEVSRRRASRAARQVARRIPLSLATA